MTPRDQVPTPETAFLVRAIAAEFLPALCEDVASARQYVTLCKTPKSHLKLYAGHQMEALNRCAAVSTAEWMIGTSEYPSIRRKLGSYKPFVRGMLRLVTNRWGTVTRPLFRFIQVTDACPTVHQTNIVTSEFIEILPVKKDPKSRNWSKDLEDNHPWLRHAELSFFLLSLFLLDFPEGYDIAKAAWDEDNAKSNNDAGFNSRRAYLTALGGVMDRDGEDSLTARSLSSCLRLLTGSDDGERASQDLVEGKCNREKTRAFIAADSGSAIPKSRRPIAVCGGCGLIAVGEKDVTGMKLCGRCGIMREPFYDVTLLVFVAHGIVKIIVVQFVQQLIGKLITKSIVTLFQNIDVRFLVCVNPMYDLSGM